MLFDLRNKQLLDAKGVITERTGRSCYLVAELLFASSANDGMPNA